MRHAVHYCEDVAQISRESGDAPWEIVGWELATPGDRGSVWFASGQVPGVRVVVTVLLDGTVIGFEVHDEGTERAHGRLPIGETLPALARVSIGTRLVRKVPIAELATMARARLRELAGLAERTSNRVANLYDQQGIEVPSLYREVAQQARDLRADTKRPGRPGHPLAWYARLAVAYEQWQESGERLQALAKRVHLTDSGLRAALHVARTKGLLDPAPKGRAGGMATDKARRLIEEENDDGLS